MAVVRKLTGDWRSFNSTRTKEMYRADRALACKEGDSTRVVGQTYSKMCIELR